MSMNIEQTLKNRFAAPLAEMLGVATLLYFCTLALSGLTKLVIFSDKAHGAQQLCRQAASL